MEVGGLGQDGCYETGHSYRCKPAYIYTKDIKYENNSNDKYLQYTRYILQSLFSFKYLKQLVFNCNTMFCRF